MSIFPGTSSQSEFFPMRPPAAFSDGELEGRSPSKMQGGLRGRSPPRIQYFYKYSQIHKLCQNGRSSSISLHELYQNGGSFSISRYTSYTKMVGPSVFPDTRNRIRMVGFSIFPGPNHTRTTDDPYFTFISHALHIFSHVVWLY